MCWRWSVETNTWSSFQDSINVQFHLQVILLETRVASDLRSAVSQRRGIYLGLQLLKQFSNEGPQASPLRHCFLSELLVTGNSAFVMQVGMPGFLLTSRKESLCVGWTIPVRCGKLIDKMISSKSHLEISKRRKVQIGEKEGTYQKRCACFV